MSLHSQTAQGGRPLTAFWDVYSGESQSQAHDPRSPRQAPPLPGTRGGGPALLRGVGGRGQPAVDSVAAGQHCCPAHKPARGPRRLRRGRGAGPRRPGRRPGARGWLLSSFQPGSRPHPRAPRPRASPPPAGPDAPPVRRPSWATARRTCTSSATAWARTWRARRAGGWAATWAGSQVRSARPRPGAGGGGETGGGGGETGARRERAPRGRPGRARPQAPREQAVGGAPTVRVFTCLH